MQLLMCKTPKVDFLCKNLRKIYHVVKFCDDRIRIAKIRGLHFWILAGYRHLTAHAQKPAYKLRCKVFWICNHPVKCCDNPLRIAKVVDISILPGGYSSHLTTYAQKAEDKFRSKMFWICFHPVKFGNDRLRIEKVIDVSLFYVAAILYFNSKCVNVWLRMSMRIGIRFACHVVHYYYEWWHSRADLKLICHDFWCFQCKLSLRMRRKSGVEFQISPKAIPILQFWIPT